MAAETAASPTFAELQRHAAGPVAARVAVRCGARGQSRAGALLSDGLRIGYAHGFDSGPFMAHVYADEATGRTAAGPGAGPPPARRRTCVAFRDIRALAETRRARRGRRRGGARAPAGHRRPRRRLRALPAARAGRPAPGPGHRRRHRPGGARGGPRRPRAALGVDDRADDAARRRLRPRTRWVRCPPGPDVVVELGLYGIYHDDAPDRAPLRRPGRARRARARSSSTCRPRTRRSSTSPASGATPPAARASGGCGRSGQILGYAARGRVRAGVGDRRPPRHLPRRAPCGGRGA